MSVTTFAQDCTLCNGISGSAMEDKASHLASICMDPLCPESTCEECSDHEECCQECDEHDGGNCEDCADHQDYCEECVEEHCGILDLIDRTGPHCNYHKDYACHGSCFELFGEQATEMFGPGALPELPIDVASSESKSLRPGMVTAWDASFDMGQYHTPPRLEHDGSDGSFRATAGILMQAAAASTVPLNTQEGPHTTQLMPKSCGDYMAQKHHIPHPPVPETCCSTLYAPSQSPNHNHRLITCQWADERGEACGELFSLGDELHEHLKAAHNIKNEVFCRWLGCCVGSHRYANSVQRHTWGHSGYRPYKCPECSEGFAAAAVRNEHVANIHLKQKIFSCDVCGHRCTSATNLKRHKDEKHKSERFQCEFCNKHGKRTLFPRGPNLARHFRKCKFVLAQYPDADGAAEGKISDDWFPPGYKRGHHGMNRAKVTPPSYMPVV